MAKKIKAVVKLQLDAGKATAGPPVGSSLGPHGINIGAFVKEFNEKTAKEAGFIIPVVITIFEDRSFTFVIDSADEDETLGALNAGTALARQLNEVVIPEVDSYVYGKMASKAGATVYEDLTDSNTYDSLATANAVQDEASVPEQGRIAVLAPMTYKHLKADEKAVLDTDAGQEMRTKGVVGEMDGTTIQKVKQSLLGTGVNYILAHPIATTFALKLAEYKIHTDAPGVSGSLVEGRVYYTAFVRNNKKDCIYVSKTKASKPADPTTPDQNETGDDQGTESGTN